MPLKLGCQQEGCTLPWGHVTDGAIVVVSRHNGAKHTNILSIRTLVKLALASGWLSAAELQEIVHDLKVPGREISVVQLTEE